MQRVSGGEWDSSEGGCGGVAAHVALMLAGKQVLSNPSVTHCICIADFPFHLVVLG